MMASAGRFSTSAAALGAFLLAAIAVHATENDSKESDTGIDTDNLFAWTVGSDVGDLGEKQLQWETAGRFGKRAGSYAAMSQTFEAEFTPIENLKLSLGQSYSLYEISGVPGFDDRHQPGFQNVSFDVKYRLLDRAQGPFGLAIDIEPQRGLFDETSGEAADQYGFDLTVAMDKELIRNRMVGAFNLLYQPETSRFHATDMWQQEATIGVAAALIAQVRPDILIGAEGRYLRKYESLGFNNFSGHALFLGPTVFVKLSERSFVLASLSVQVAGRSTDDPGWLDLANFERVQTKFQFGLNL